MYKQCLDIFGNLAHSVLRLEDGACIPFDPANTDYQAFKREVAAGTPLEDPEGNVMTQAEVDAFLQTIP